MKHEKLDHTNNYCKNENTKITSANRGIHRTQGPRERPEEKHKEKKTPLRPLQKSCGKAIIIDVNMFIILHRVEQTPKCRRKKNKKRKGEKRSSSTKFPLPDIPLTFLSRFSLHSPPRADFSAVSLAVEWQIDKISIKANTMAGAIRSRRSLIFQCEKMASDTVRKRITLAICLMCPDKRQGKNKLNQSVRM